MCRLRLALHGFPMTPILVVRAPSPSLTLCAIFLLALGLKRQIISG